MITAGVDLGLAYVKAVILKDWKVVGHSIVPSGNDPEIASRLVLEKALEMAQLKRDDIDFIVSTGFGRKRTSLANDTVSEISANVRGVQWLKGSNGVRTIIDIGAHDAKVITLDDYHIIHNFAMNDRYDEGMGGFLEDLAKILNVSLEQMGELSLRSKNPVDFNSSLVFNRSEVANLIYNGYKKEDIIAGFYRSVARRLAVLAKRVGIRGSVFFDGGPAKNVGMIKAMERELGIKLYVPEMPQLVTAIGATVIAAERFSENG